jgi:hypothetical protein
MSDSSTVTNLEEARKAFYEGLRGPHMPFVLNDCVRVLRGPVKGMTGAVVSLEQTEPELVYLVECGEDGRDSLVPARDLQLVELGNSPTD